MKGKSSIERLQSDYIESVAFSKDINYIIRIGRDSIVRSVNDHYRPYQEGLNFSIDQVKTLLKNIFYLSIIFNFNQTSRVGERVGHINKPTTKLYNHYSKIFPITKTPIQDSYLSRIVNSLKIPIFMLTDVDFLTPIFSNPIYIVSENDLVKASESFYLRLLLELFKVPILYENSIKDSDSGCRVKPDCYIQLAEEKVTIEFKRNVITSVTERINNIPFEPPFNMHENVISIFSQITYQSLFGSSSTCFLIDRDSLLLMDIFLSDDPNSIKHDLNSIKCRTTKLNINQSHYTSALVIASFVLKRLESLQDRHAAIKRFKNKLRIRL
ncbi:uncharacterized protein RJT21DRAFT_117855 [Scheffersomyces amazonensis]|uniref:uncharacterized protein n=1 Tax=Scheffersomyces amazonensis TaxID=1078765 RepID=UPI00315C92C5